MNNVVVCVDHYVMEWSNFYAMNLGVDILVLSGYEVSGFGFGVGVFVT